MANNRGAYQKKQENIDNVYARYKLLLAGIKDPKSVSKYLISTLSGQRKFSKLSIQNSKIKPLSLNTLKSISDEILKNESSDGKGFMYLDSLRCQLRDLTSNQNKSKTVQKKERQVETIEVLRQQLQQSDLLNLQRSKAYHDLFSKIAIMTSDKNIDQVTRSRLLSLIDDHNALYNDLLSPNSIEQGHGIRMVKGGKESE